MMLAEYTHHQLCSFPYEGPKLHGYGDSSTGAGHAVSVLCTRGLTDSSHRIRRPQLQLTHLQQSWIPAKASIRATYSDCSTAMAEQTGQGKWSVTVTEVIPGTIDKVWAVLADFDGIQRHFPQFFGSCETVEGEKNKPGSRRVVGTVPTPEGKVIEARERLVTLDDVNHTTTFVVEHVTLGWTGCQASISCESVENGHTLVKWTHELNPLSTISEEGYMRKQSDFYHEVLEITKGIVAK
ncbi:unnamed protein product [Calypogeia fissa]